jgi:hypothetical protein
MTERERAEQLFSYIHYHSGEKGIDAILAFVREERAQAVNDFVACYERAKWEAMAGEGKVLNIRQFASWFLAKALREEGGQT